MNITKRFILLLSMGLILLLGAFILHNSLTIFVVYNLICFIFLSIDYFISPDEKIIEIERYGEDKLSIYEREQISFRVYNKSDYRLYVEIKDEIPDFHFKSENRLMKGFIESHEKKVFGYYVVPTKRGAFIFKNIHVKYKGKLGLCTKIFKVNLQREYKVYPNLKNIRKYRMNICNNRRFKQGQRNLRLIGRGTSFESLREYVNGDDYRKINWKATARVNKPIVNQYEPEKNQHIHILIDTGRPMSHTIRGYRKLDIVVDTALILTDIVNQNGDKAGLLLFNTDINNMIMPGKGSVHRNKILEALYHIEHTNETSNYDEAFYHFKKKERHRSIIFMFTDFDTLEEAEYMLRSLPIISKNNIVVIMIMKNEGIEKFNSVEVRNPEDIFNKGVALELIQERRKIINVLNKRGIMCVECGAEEFQGAVINKYIDIKNKTYL